MEGCQPLTLPVTILQEQHHLVRPQTIVPEFLELLRSAYVDDNAPESPDDFELPLMCHHSDAHVTISNKMVDLWLGRVFMHNHR